MGGISRLLFVAYRVCCFTHFPYILTKEYKYSICCSRYSSVQKAAAKHGSRTRTPRPSRSRTSWTPRTPWSPRPPWSPRAWISSITTDMAILIIIMDTMAMATLSITDIMDIMATSNITDTTDTITDIMDITTDGYSAVNKNQPF